MSENSKIDPCDTMRANLIAAAIGLQQCTKTASNIVPIPGGDRVIAIGTPAEVAQLLAIEPTIPAQVPAAEVRAQALEEAAEVCEAERVEDTGTDGDTGYNNAITHCAAAIRSLAQQSPADKASEVRAADLEREIAQLKERLEKKHKSHFITSQALHNVIVGNQSAWIEWQHGAGAEAAMTWIHNGLAGPGLIPGGKEAQPWFDANQDDRYEIPPMKEAGAAPSTADSAGTGAMGEGAEA